MYVVLGTTLLVAGAILTFAVDRDAEGIDLQAAGWVLMIGGLLAFAVGIVRTAAIAQEQRTRYRRERLVSADGTDLVENVSST